MLHDTLLVLTRGPTYVRAFVHGSRHHVKNCSKPATVDIWDHNIRLIHFQSYTVESLPLECNALSHPWPYNLFYAVSS